MMACIYEHADVVEKLLACDKTDLNLKDKVKFTLKQL